MTRTAVDNTIARLKAWVREMHGNRCPGTLDDLEALRQHNEAQAKEVERLRAALIAAAERVESDAARVGTQLSAFDGDERAIVEGAIRRTKERARVLRAAAEGKP